MRRFKVYRNNRPIGFEIASFPIQAINQAVLKFSEKAYAVSAYTRMNYAKSFVQLSKGGPVEIWCAGVSSEEVSSG